MGRIIAQGSVASKPAQPVPIALGGVRLFAQIALIWNNTHCRALVYFRGLSQGPVPRRVVRRLGQDR